MILTCSSNGSIASVGEERANLSAIVYLSLCGFCPQRFPLPLGAGDGLRYLTVALPWPSIKLFCTTSWYASIKRKKNNYVEGKWELEHFMLQFPSMRLNILFPLKEKLHPISLEYEPLL